MGNIFIYFISCTKAMLANEEAIKQNCLMWFLLWNQTVM